VETFFLACFVGGALFTVASFAIGHVGGHHAAHAGHHGAGLPLLNASSLVGFVAWFGAAGYLIVHFLGEVAIWGALVGGLLAGGLGWYLIARFLGLILAGEREMDPADYRLVGTVGEVTVAIPAGGVGEVIFAKAGARRGEAARGLGGMPIRRGAEIVITDYREGCAIVQPWSEFVGGSKEQESWTSSSSA
jgi:membrane protein implicated in regulation of membrane protease activity